MRILVLGLALSACTDSYVSFKDLPALRVDVHLSGRVDNNDDSTQPTYASVAIGYESPFLAGASSDCPQVDVSGTLNGTKLELISAGDIRQTVHASHGRVVAAGRSHRASKSRSTGRIPLI